MAKSTKDRLRQDQIQKSINLLKSKFDARTKIDPLKNLDKFGIDLIMNNESLYKQF